MKNISIIIPCLNEEVYISQTINKVNNYLKREFSKYKYEIILIDDGSSDNTEFIINKIKKKNTLVNLIKHPINLGRGKAIKNGFKFSKGDIVITIDSDLSYDVQHIGEIIKNFEQIKNLDAVIVSAYMKGGKVQNVPIIRLMISKIANWILSGFFPIKLSTVTCLVRGYDGKTIRSLYLAENGKEIHLEILRKLTLIKAKIIEIPGNLIWKIEKQKKRRKADLNIFNAAKNHFLYALFLKPNKLLKFVTITLLIIAFYELANILFQIFNYFSYNGEFLESLWLAIKYNFEKSPHSFFIGISALIIGLQFLSFMIILQISKHNQDELLQHILPLLRKKNK